MADIQETEVLMEDPTPLPYADLVTYESTVTSPAVLERIRGHFTHRFFEPLGLVNPQAGWIAGGAIRRIVAGEKDSDTDFFFRGEANLRSVRDRLVADFEGKVVLDNENVLKLETRLGMVDLVRRYFPHPQATIASFDFTVSMGAVSPDGVVVVGSTFFPDLASKRLVVNALPAPVDTLRRLQKYVKQGYEMCPGGMVKLADAIFALQQRPSDTRNVFYLD